MHGQQQPGKRDPRSCCNESLEQRPPLMNWNTDFVSWWRQLRHVTCLPISKLHHHWRNYRNSRTTFRACCHRRFPGNCSAARERTEAWMMCCELHGPAAVTVQRPFGTWCYMAEAIDWCEPSKPRVDPPALLINCRSGKNYWILVKALRIRSLRSRHVDSTPLATKNCRSLHCTVWQDDLNWDPCSTIPRLYTLCLKKHLRHFWL